MTSAVTQQIQSLELQLGVSLLAKAGRRIVLTEAGERYFSMITSEIERISDATGTIRGFRSVTTLVIRATPTLSNKWLLPRLSRFLDAEPNLEVRLDGTNEPTDFNRELVDLEIRHGDGRWPGLFVEGLSEEVVPACAQPWRRPSLSATDLPRFRLIHSVKSQAQWGRWFKLAGLQPQERWRRALRPQPYGDRRGRRRHGNRAGEPDDDGARARRRDAGLPRGAAPSASARDAWIVCPRDHLRQKKVRGFLDWLRAERELVEQANAV